MGLQASGLLQLSSFFKFFTQVERLQGCAGPGMDHVWTAAIICELLESTVVRNTILSSQDVRLWWILPLPPTLALAFLENVTSHWTLRAPVALGTQPVGQLLRITHHQVAFWVTW